MDKHYKWSNGLDLDMLEVYKMTLLDKSRNRLGRKWAKCVSLDQAYIRWLETIHKSKKHIYDYNKDAPTFGMFCEELREKGYRII